MLNKCIWNYVYALPLNTLMRSMLSRKVNSTCQRCTFIHEIGAKMTFFPRVYHGIDSALSPLAYEHKLLWSGKKTCIRKHRN